MRYQTYVAAVAVMAIGLVAAGCSGSPNSNTATSTTASQTITASVSQATTTTGAGPNLKSLMPTPVNTTRTDGPDSIHDNGIHLHFLVDGSPTDVMSAYKTALEGMNWSVSVVSSGGAGGGGGATYTGTSGNTYGVFSGGGYGGVTDVNACAWPSQPANPDCGHGNR
jgi:hypothetical protein